MPLEALPPGEPHPIDFDPHWYRHTYATEMLRTGAPVEVVSKLLGHASVTTTVGIYGHLTVEDARALLERAGWFADTAVQLWPAGRSPPGHRPGCWNG